MSHPLRDRFTIPVLRRRPKRRATIAVFVAPLIAALLWAPTASASVGAPAVSSNQTVLSHDADRSNGQNKLPCDIYAADRSPCAAAYSSTRALFKNYKGPLYQVQRASDLKTLNIGVLKPGGYADAAAQDRFCAKSACTVRTIYDQTANRNDLHPEGPSPAYAPPPYGYYSNRVPHLPVPASALPVLANGHHVYGLKFDDSGNALGYAYNNLYTNGIPQGAEPESMYMVASGTFSGSGCCFDFGNSEVSATDTGDGHMDTVNVSSLCWDECPPGPGPWLQADIENGVYFSNKPATTPGQYGQYGGPFRAGFGYCCSYTDKNTAVPFPFVTAMLNNDGKKNWALKGGNAQTASSLDTYFSGALPPTYAPMKKEGAIILGSGGDQGVTNGEFFEGVLTAGVPSHAAENAVQANIHSVHYQ